MATVPPCTAGNGASVGDGMFSGEVAYLWGVDFGPHLVHRVVTKSLIEPEPRSALKPLRGFFKGNEVNICICTLAPYSRRRPTNRFKLISFTEKNHSLANNLLMLHSRHSPRCSGQNINQKPQTRALLMCDRTTETKVPGVKMRKEDQMEFS